MLPVQVNCILLFSVKGDLIRRSAWYIVVSDSDIDRYTVVICTGEGRLVRSELRQTRWLSVIPQSLISNSRRLSIGGVISALPRAFDEQLVRVCLL
jgi:hypothetical protein